MTVMRSMGLAPVLPPDASVTETPTEYIVHLRVPGFARDELAVEIALNVLTVRGDQMQTTVDCTAFRLHQRLEESFRLPVDVDTSRVTADFTHGALEIHAPRGRPSARALRRVPIGHRIAVNPDAAGV